MASVVSSTNRLGYGTYSQENSVNIGNVVLTLRICDTNKSHSGYTRVLEINILGLINSKCALFNESSSDLINLIRHF